MAQTEKMRTAEISSPKKLAIQNNLTEIFEFDKQLITQSIIIKQISIKHTHNYAPLRQSYN